MVGIYGNILLGSVSMPSFYKVKYMGDYVWAFDIDARYHGYTRDKQVFHVYDENTNAYTSYESPALFLSWLASYKGGNYTPPVTTTTKNGYEPKGFNIAPGVKPWQILLPLAAVGALIYAVK